MLDPEEGRRLPLRGRDKGFSKVLVRPAPPATAQRPRRFPHQPGPSRRGARSQHTAAARPAAPDTASCSPGCADQPLPRPSSRCALPTMQLPWLPRPIRALAYPEMGPRRPALLSSAGALLVAPTSIPKGSGSPAPTAAGFWAGSPGGRGAGVQAARRLCSRCHRQRAHHTHAPQALPRPFPDAQSPPAAVAASSKSGKREIARRGRQQRHHVTGTAQ